MRTSKIFNGKWYVICDGERNVGDYDTVDQVCAELQLAKSTLQWMISMKRKLRKNKTLYKMTKNGYLSRIL